MANSSTAADLTQAAVGAGEEQLHPLVEPVGAEPAQLGAGERHPREMRGEFTHAGHARGEQAIRGAVILHDGGRCRLW